MKKPRSENAIDYTADKWCWLCRATHPVDRFGRNKRRPDGLNQACREAWAARARERRAAARSLLPKPPIIRSFSPDKFTEKFWDKVEKSDGCWIWKAARRHRGYGAVGRGGHIYTASRIAWELTHGTIPEGLFILHRCDTPPCVRPDHLFLGTKKDNWLDAKKKGRSKLPPRLSGPAHWHWQGGKLEAAAL